MKFKRTILHSPHLLYELFSKSLILCGVEACPHLGLPDFWLVKFFRLQFSAQNIRVLKLGKTVLGIGKSAVSTIGRRNK